MGTLKKKSTDTNQKITPEDSTAVNKKKPEPVKAQPKNDGVGGIFTHKVVAIMKKLFGKE